MRQNVLRPDSKRPMVFHSTEWGVEILSTGIILANSTIDLQTIGIKATDTRFDAEHHETRGICVTRSFYFARQFSETIFGLDRDAIRHRSRLVKRAEVGAYDLADDHGDYRIEAEEFIICPGLDVARHVVAIWLSEERRNDPEYKQIEGSSLFMGHFRQP